jgi:hypothetical protein
MRLSVILIIIGILIPVGSLFFVDNWLPQSGIIWNIQNSYVPIPIPDSWTSVPLPQGFTDLRYLLPYRWILLVSIIVLGVGLVLHKRS